MPNVTVTINLKPSLLDAQGRVVEQSLHSLGFSEISDVRVGKSISFTVANADDIDSRVKSMCDKLLANPVIENYTFEVEA